MCPEHEEPGGCRVIETKYGRVQLMNFKGVWRAMKAFSPRRSLVAASGAAAFQSLLALLFIGGDFLLSLIIGHRYRLCARQP